MSPPNSSFKIQRKREGKFSLSYTVGKLWFQKTIRKRVSFKQTRYLEIKFFRLSSRHQYMKTVTRKVSLRVIYKLRKEFVR